MRSAILTILPHPSERQVQTRPALTRDACSQGTEARDAAARVAPDTLPSIESILLQRLLAEIESRQLARAQPTYVIEQSPAARHATLVRTLWCLLWVLSMAMCVVSVKYMDSQAVFPQTGAGQSRSIESLTATVSDQKKEFSTMVDSLHVLADAMALNSARTATIPTMLNRLGSDLQQIRVQPVRAPVDLLPQPAMPTQAAEATLIPMGGHHHAPLGAATVAPEGATVHYNSLAVMDYWLVPRVVSGVQTMVKVVPISQRNGASFVHDVAEARDYILSPSGEWIAVSEATGTK